MENDLDRDLLERFHAPRDDLPEAPFVNRIGTHIEAISNRRVWMRRGLMIIGLLAIAAVSPWLIDASVLLSNTLDSAFSAAESFLETTIGLVLTLLVTVPLLVLNRQKLL